MVAFLPPWSVDEPAGDRFRGEVARTYLAERVGKPEWAAEHEAVSRCLLRIPENSRVLDVPFGTGRFVDLYRARSLAISGVEISPDMLAVAREQLGDEYTRMDIRQGNALHLPYEDGTFDAIVCVRFLESIIPWKDVQPCLKEFRRVCSGWGIIRINSRFEHDPPQDEPGPDERMSCSFYLPQIEDIVRGCGWKMESSEITHTDKQGEKRVCLLRAI